MLTDPRTYADLAFIPWNGIVTNPMFLKDQLYDGAVKYTNYWDWQERLGNLESVKRTYGN